MPHLASNRPAADIRESASGPAEAGHTDSTEELTAIVGQNLRRLRTRHGHSLERFAALSGVSRAMISQIETGKSVPTIGTVWKLANALSVPFATLIGTPDNQGTVLMPRERAKRLTASDGRFVSRALFPFDSPRKVEFYELEIAPRHGEEAEAHAPGTRENLIVTRGTVEVRVGSEPRYVLAEGDAIVFEADVPHGYRNLGPDTAVLYLVMVYVETIG